jgi:hypothetical protein
MNTSQRHTPPSLQNFNAVNFKYFLNYENYEPHKRNNHVLLTTSKTTL